MVHIKNKQIHPELRLLGSTIRLTAPFMKIRMMPGMKMLQDQLMKGRWTGTFSECETVEVPRGDGTSLRLLVCIPYNLKKEVPGLLWIHGGGYALGLPEQDEHFVKRFMEAADCVVVMPDYTKSVEKPYPAALEDCYLALKWMRVHAKEYGIRRNQLFVGGNSAGGGLAAALTLYARDKGEISIAFQMPLYPMIDDRPTSTSRDNDAPVWNTNSNVGAWQLYLGEKYGAKDVPVYAAPARAEDLTGLPPACSYIGTLEPFYAEAVTYMLRLKEAGVPVHFKRFHGCFHGFDIVSKKSTPVKGAVAFSAEVFRYAVNNYFANQPGEE